VPYLINVYEKKMKLAIMPRKAGLSVSVLMVSPLYPLIISTYTITSPTYTPTSPTYAQIYHSDSPVSPIYVPISPTYVPTSPTSASTSPTYMPTSPTSVSTSPTYMPTSPTSVPTTPLETDMKISCFASKSFGDSHLRPSILTRRNANWAVCVTLRVSKMLFSTIAHTLAKNFFSTYDAEELCMKLFILKVVSTIS